jgi:hypothetical protein
VRPKTIVYFEWIIFGTILLNVFDVYLTWNQIIDQVIALFETWSDNSAVAFILACVIFGYVLTGTLTLLVSRRRNKIAMWVSIALFAIGLSVWFARPPTADELLGSDTILSALQTIGQGVAYYLLFTPSARLWMRREDERAKLGEVFH